MCDRIDLTRFCVTSFEAVSGYPKILAFFPQSFLVLHDMWIIIAIEIHIKRRSL